MNNRDFVANGGVITQLLGAHLLDSNTSQHEAHQNGFFAGQHNSFQHEAASSREDHFPMSNRHSGNQHIPETHSPILSPLPNDDSQQTAHSSDSTAPASFLQRYHQQHQHLSIRSSETVPGSQISSGAKGNRSHSHKQQQGTMPEHHSQNHIHPHPHPQPQPHPHSHHPSHTRRRTRNLSSQMDVARQAGFNTELPAASVGYSAGSPTTPASKPAPLEGNIYYGSKLENASILKEFIRLNSPDLNARVLDLGSMMNSASDANQNGSGALSFRAHYQAEQEKAKETENEKAKAKEKDKDETRKSANRISNGNAKLTNGLLFFHNQHQKANSASLDSSSPSLVDEPLYEKSSASFGVKYQHSSTSVSVSADFDSRQVHALHATLRDGNVHQASVSCGLPNRRLSSTATPLLLNAANDIDWAAPILPGLSDSFTVLLNASSQPRGVGPALSAASFNSNSSPIAPQLSTFLCSRLGVAVFYNRLVSGSLLLKYSSSSPKQAPHLRLLWASEDLQKLYWGELKQFRRVRGELSVRAIHSVESGVRSTSFANRVKQGGVNEQDLDRCFSVMTDSRVLDVQCVTPEEKDMWNLTFIFLMHFTKTTQQLHSQAHTRAVSHNDNDSISLKPPSQMSAIFAQIQELRLHPVARNVNILSALSIICDECAKVKNGANRFGQASHSEDMKAEQRTTLTGMTAAAPPTKHPNDDVATDAAGVLIVPEATSGRQKAAHDAVPTNAGGGDEVLDGAATAGSADGHQPCSPFQVHVDGPAGASAQTPALSVSELSTRHSLAPTERSMSSFLSQPSNMPSISAALSASLPSSRRHSLSATPVNGPILLIPTLNPQQLALLRRYYEEVHLRMKALQKEMERQRCDNKKLSELNNKQLNKLQRVVDDLTSENHSLKRQAEIQRLQRPSLAVEGLLRTPKRSLKSRFGLVENQDSAQNTPRLGGHLKIPSSSPDMTFPEILSFLGTSDDSLGAHRKRKELNE